MQPERVRDASGPASGLRQATVMTLGEACMQRGSFSGPAVGMVLLLAWGEGACAQTVLSSGVLTTPAARANDPALCKGTTAFPTAQAWTPSAITAKPPPATSGTPRIEQMRGGKVIAVYTSFSDKTGCTYKNDGTDHVHPAAAAASGCGPFTREYSYRLWDPHDIFVVYPAVYQGGSNNPWFGPESDDSADYAAGITHVPNFVTVTGLAGAATRPVILLNTGASNNSLGQSSVYFAGGTGMVFENIDVIATSGASVGQSGVYINGATNLTISNVEVSGFETANGSSQGGADGIFGTPNNAGYLLLDQVEIDHNGGTNGPAHNAYINASTVDPKFVVIMQNSWSHDAFYGHLFKSRAQHTVMTANYFEGGLKQSGYAQAEAYLLDVPNGGTLVARNNVFVKNMSGADSNGMSIVFGEEGFTDKRVQSIDIENNTFIAYALTYNGSDPLFPMSFFTPGTPPLTAGFPAGVHSLVLKNAFVGYCQTGQAMQDYRGNIAVIEAFAELGTGYTLTTKVDSNEAGLAATHPNYKPVVGTSTYAHVARPGAPRAVPTLGAFD